MFLCFTVVVHHHYINFRCWVCFANVGRISDSHWICEIGTDQSHASWSFLPSLAVPFRPSLAPFHCQLEWIFILYTLIFSWWKMLEDQLIIQHLLETNIFGSRGERIREICLADCLICFYCGYIPGSSKWPRLDPQVTFWGLKCPPFGESKGHFEEAGKLQYMFIANTTIIVWGTDMYYPNDPKTFRSDIRRWKNRCFLSFLLFGVGCAAGLFVAPWHLVK